MAAKQPEKKDTKMLAVGVPRAVILAELGAPISTTKNGNETIDIFSFKQGYGKAAKFDELRLLASVYAAEYNCAF